MAYTSKSHLARRAINFDLNIEALRENYSETNPKGAYKEIRSFFEKNGFFHRQGSGYCSLEKISDFELTDLIRKMFKTFPWLDACSKKFDATDIGEIYDMKEIFHKDSAKEILGEKQKGMKQTEKKSVLQRLKSNQEKIIQEHQKGLQKKEKGEQNREVR